MKRSMWFVCLLVAGFAFLTFTFVRADTQPRPGEKEDPRLERPKSNTPAPGSSGPLTKPDGPKGSSGPIVPITEPPKPGTGPVVPPGGKQQFEKTKFVQIKKDANGNPL